jgi:lipoprotein
MKQVIGISILLLGASFVMSFLSCGDKGKGGGATVLKKFDVKYIKVWDKDVKSKATETVSGSAKEKTLEVQVDNCNRYTMVYKVDGVAGTPIEADAGNAVAKPFDIAKDASIRLVVTLKADGFEEFSHLVKITRQDTSASGVKVLLKRDEDATPFEVSSGKTYKTANTQATVVVTSEKAVMKTVKIAGSDITPTDAGKKAEKKDVVAGNVEVSVQFDDYKPYTISFTLEKVNAGEVTIEANSAIIYSGDNYGNSHVLEFNENREATVELDDVQYSLVKLEMKMDSTLEASSGLEECKDERSANYTTQPNENDIKGIFSGRLKAETSVDGNKKEFNPISGNVFTEYLISAFGTVTYKFKFTSTGKKDTEYTVNIKNNNVNKVKYSGDNGFFYSTGHGKVGLINGSPIFQWIMYSKLPLNTQSEAEFAEKSNLEYMGDDVRMLFYREEKGDVGDIYFYCNVFDDPSSKKREFVRQSGKSGVDGDVGYAFVRSSFDPQQKYVDAFVAFKDCLPQALLPTQIKNKWKKIVNKGFLFQVENGLKYKNGQRETKSLDIFYEAFNYRVQAKTYEKKETLNIGLDQDYANFLNGSNATISNPFLDGGKTELKDKSGFMPNDLMIMMPTFAGSIGDSIETIKYSIKKNGVAESTWTDVSLTPAKWSKFICLNAKDDNLTADGKITDPKTLYCYEKVANGSENNYEIEVKIKPKDSDEQVFKYKIDYKNKQTVKPMSFENEPSVDSSLFGVPTSYAECVNREAQAMFKEIMAEEFAREKLLNR